MQISEDHIAWLEGRGIDAETALRYGLSTGKRVRRNHGTKDAWTEVVRDPTGDVLVFPTVFGGRVVGEHYRRMQEKGFFQRKGSAQVFWNAECLLDPGLERGEPLVIAEGQLDALTAICCGFPFAVSMPSGASKPPEGRLPEDLDPFDPSEADSPSGRFGSLYHARAQLKATRKIIIATDADDNGIRLAAELVRRLGPGRCYRAEYPRGIKDLNELLQRHGRESVIAALNAAKPYPTEGVYRLSDIPDAGEPRTYDTGWVNWDAHFRLAEGMFVPVTGVPMHGKSVFAVNMLIRVAQRHAVRIAIASFETPVKPTLYSRMLKMALPTSIKSSTQREMDDARDWLEDRFLFIEADERRDADAVVSIDWMLDRMHDAYARYDARIFLIDPWNEIEHRRDFREGQSEYQNRAIRKLKGFAKTYGLSLIVIAHPTKDIHDKGKIRMPNLYDIDGSAAWRNKADVGFIVHRPDLSLSRADVKVDKVKYEFLGKLGTVRFQFTSLGRFEEIDDQGELEGIAA